MNSILKKLTPAALVIGTMGGSLAVATASPAHAATPNTIRRYSWNYFSWMRTSSFRCDGISSPSEKVMDVPFGGQGFSGAERNSTCTQNSTGNRIRVEFRPTGTYGWDWWADAHHKAHVSYTVGGVTWSCGDIGRLTNQRGTVTSTFPRANSQLRIFAQGTVTCANGTTVTAGFELSEGWAAIVK